ncbi:MAG: beta strand repeat-containing protein, partial [Microcystis panniformis]
VPSSTPFIYLAVSPTSVTEDGTSNLIYTFSRTGSTANTLLVNYTIGGTATNGSDYGTIGTSVTFAAGSSTATVTVDPTGDTTPEDHETVALTLASGTGYNIGTTTAVTGTILDNDTIVTLAVSPTSVTEDGTTNLVYTFTRNGITSNALTVNYTIGGTATNGNDYSSIGSSVTFAAGSSTATVTVYPAADNTLEADETVTLTLASGTGYTIGTSGAVTGTITNDDLPTITLAVSPTSVTEDGTSNLIYTFSRTGSTTSPLTVNYTIGGTATNGIDYSTIGTSVTFAAGSSTATVTVDPSTDTTPEDNETVSLTLASGTGYNIGTTAAVTGTILDNDTIVTLAVAPTSVTEDGTTNLVYTFTRNGFTSNALTVNYFIGGSATNGNDYSSIGSSVTFAAGSSTATVTVDPTADTAAEIDETIILTLASGTGYTIGTTSGVTGTITNDDLPNVTLSLTSPSTVTEDGPQNLFYVFSRTGDTTNSLTVNFNVSGSATFNNDYVQRGASSFGTTTGSVTFAAGSRVFILSLDPSSDVVSDGNETVALTLAAGTGYAVGTSGAVTGTILDNDVAPGTVVRGSIAKSRNDRTRHEHRNNYAFAALKSDGSVVTWGDSGYGGNSSSVSSQLTSGVVSFADPFNDDRLVPSSTPFIYLAVSPNNVTEDGTSNLIYTFSRTGSTANTLLVNYTIGGTATNGIDYSTIGTSVTFAAGSSTATVTVDPTGDTTPEDHETVSLTLASGTGYNIGTTAAVTGTILDNDTIVTLAVAPTSVT